MNRRGKPSRPCNRTEPAVVAVHRVSYRGAAPGRSLRTASAAIAPGSLCTRCWRPPLTGWTAIPMMNDTHGTTGTVATRMQVQRAGSSSRRSGVVMGIYDREYYRGESTGSGTGSMAWRRSARPSSPSTSPCSCSRWSFISTWLHGLRRPVPRRFARVHAAALPTLGTPDGDLPARRPLAPVREHAVPLGRRPRDGGDLREPGLPGVLPLRGRGEHARLGRVRCRVGPAWPVPRRDWRLSGRSWAS